jgi:hypothetical protein
MVAPMDLNRQIAEKLGYHVYHYDKDIPERCYYMLMDPDGDPAWANLNFNEIGPRAGERKTEDEAWRDCPNWKGDLSLAIELLDDRKFKIERIDPDNWVKVTIFTAGDPSARATTIEEAIAAAFAQIDIEAEKRVMRLEQLYKRRDAIIAEIDKYLSKTDDEESTNGA